MDAAWLALRDAKFDVVVLAFMLFHLPDPLGGLREAHRVLRAGGAVGIASWGEDPGTPGLAIWTEELDASGAAPDPRDRSVMQQALMDTPGKLTGLLETADFDSIRVWRERFCHNWTLKDLLALQCSCGMPARRLATLPARARKACKARVNARFAGLTDADLVYMPEVLFAVANRPS
jgi:SAM-dependent methyltransferase